jgi:gas vesicle protein
VADTDDKNHLNLCLTLLFRKGWCTMANESGSVKGFLLGLLAGGAIGAALALLYAPKSGSELRSDIKKRTDDLVEDAEEYIQTAKNKAVDMINDGKKRADALIVDARKRAEGLLHDAEKVLSGAKDKASGLTSEGEKIKDAMKAGVDAFRDERAKSK